MTLPLLTLAEVAALLRLSPRSVRRYVASGQLRVLRIGRAVRVKPRELDAFLAACDRRWRRS
jgi:excisionase family DNA binding protein